MTRSELAERIRRVLVESALRAYEDAGLRGLCEEGRWEAAIDAMRTADLGPALESPEPPAPREPR